MLYVIQEKISLLEALERLFPESSKKSLHSWIASERIFVNEALVQDARMQLVPGQALRIAKKSSFLEGGVKILYQDSHLVVVDKPAGLLSVATAFQKEKTLHGLLKRKFFRRRVFPVHRLDQDTSGVMLFAFTLPAQAGLKQQFARHSIERRYVALVEKEILEEGRWESFLREDAAYFVKSCKRGGMRAVTHYKPLRTEKGYTLLELTLETGRKNQIRVHCSEAGHPVAGDKKYGARTNPYRRLCLHAHFLEFVHPILRKTLSFSSPLKRLW
ncbi:MAG: hypothetical protein A3I15_06350 [Chlamydiae bacterium RIFCSPLOWO2_02_FULL_49_12]|nr:MAG: hypothetical protein A3I15_06350 [Chlamydiae bacterium RIFCSPLOWO2_02_FULL_49_12]